MGSNKVTGLAAPTDANDATSKTYVDGILGSATAASASAAAAATSESNAATSETNASNSASSASTSEANAAASYDSFDDRYLGAKATAPTVDNDGDALIVGALYFNNTTNIMYVYGSGGWQAAGSSVNGTSDRNTYTATAGQTVFAATYDTGYVDVYLNGVKLVAGTDFTATNGTSITLATGAAVNDVVDIVAYGTFVLADHYTEAQSDARYVQVAGDTMTGDLDITGTLTSDGLTVDGDVALNDQSVTLGTTANSYNELRFFDSVNTGGTIRLRSSAGVLETYNSNAKRMSIANNGDISFYEDTGTTPKLVWKSADERLGIGTSLPTTKLQSKGGSISTPTNNAGLIANASASFVVDHGNDYGIYTGYVNSTNDAVGIAATRTLGGALPLSLQPFGGNVGIGTSSPSHPLTSAVNAASSDPLTSGANYALAIQNTDATAGNAVSMAFGHGGYSYTNFISSIRTGTGSDPKGDLIFGGRPSDGATFVERMRIDSGGNLLVGESSNFIATSTTATGLAVTQEGRFTLSRSGTPMNIGRLGTDGSLIDFWKNGTTVGSIGVEGGDLTIGDAGAGLQFRGIDPCIRPHNMTTNSPSDNAVDLGRSNTRFKDLYLSGGIQFDSRSNKLDDYEEGTWTPVPSMTGSNLVYNLSGTTGSYGRYTKVGNLVTCWFDVYFNVTSGGTGQARLGGFPFSTSMSTQNGGYTAANLRNCTALNAASDVHGYYWANNLYFEQYNGYNSTSIVYRTANNIRVTGEVAFYIS
jgi:hypothetical protein